MSNLHDVLSALGVSKNDYPNISIAGPAKLSDAQSEHISFLANPKYEAEVYTTKAGAVLVSNDFHPKQNVAAILVKVDDPYSAITKVLSLFDVGIQANGIDDTAKVVISAQLSQNVSIGAFSYVGAAAKVGINSQIGAQVFIGQHVKIGNDCIIHPGVKIYARCEIGDNCIIHAGTIIGSDGFGFAPQKDGTFQKIPQTGNVVIENNVEIGSNCTIDRATMGSTLIEQGVKLDNLIQVGHNAVIGKNTVVAAQSGISGSTKLGEGCMIGGQVGFVGHISIAPFTKINAKSGISKGVKQQGAKLNGIPAFNFTDSLRSQSVYRKLPELQKKVKEIEEMLSLLRKKSELD